MLLSSDQEKFEDTKKGGYQMSENQRTDNNTTTKKQDKQWYTKQYTEN